MVSGPIADKVALFSARLNYTDFHILQILALPVSRDSGHRLGLEQAESMAYSFCPVRRITVYFSAGSRSFQRTFQPDPAI